MMKLAIGKRVVGEGNARFQVVGFDGVRVRLRRMDYRASWDGRGPAAWCPSEDDAERHEVLRGNFDVLFREDDGPVK